MQQRIVKAFVGAYLRADVSECVEILKSMPAAIPERKHCEAVMTATQANPFRSQADPKEAIAQLRTALESPPADPALFRIELMAAVRLFGQLRRTGEGLRFLRLLKQISESDVSVLAQANVLYCESIMAYEQAAMSQAYELMSQACRLKVPVGCGLWYSLRLALALTAIHRAEFALAEQVLAEVEAHPSSEPSYRNGLADRRLLMLIQQGKVKDGLAFLNSLPAATTPYMRRLYTLHRISLLSNAGRFAEAQAVLDTDGKELDEYTREYRQARICLDRGDNEGVREHCRRAIGSGGANTLTIRDTAVLLVSAELAAGRTSAARSLLKMVDPDENADSMHWVTIHLLEGRVEEAARRLRRMVDKMDLGTLRNVLLGGYGLTGPQVSMLWRLAEELDPAGVASSSAAAPAPPAAAPRAVATEAELIGDSPAMREVREKVARFAPLSETVLITGETGTGKDLVARLLHERSPRADRPFIAVNCAAISDTLIESELFGHVKGAFTGAERDHEGLFDAAGEGTIFLDEISSMSVRLQAALLRVLENGEIRPVGSGRPRRISCRILAASNRPLEEMVRRGEFRSDLYYRLTRLLVCLPPLRERTADITLLAGHFLNRVAAPGQVVLGEDFVAALRTHDWPGNVRELRNEMERAILLAGGENVLRAESLSFLAAEGKTDGGVAKGSGAGSSAATPAGDGALPRVGERLDVLRAIFQRERKMTRAKVIRMLSCSPNSATRYLKLLQEEGLIERVHTSGSLHTSYFILKGPAGSAAPARAD